jgi:hypothetical protein
MDHGAHWWLIFPLFWLALPLGGMAIGAFAMWLRYRRDVATLELLRTYAAQGKEPPAEIANIVRNGRYRYGRYRDYRSAILLGSLSAAFAGLAFFNTAPRPQHGFVVAAVILGALTLAYVLSALLRPPHDGR